MSKIYCGTCLYHKLRPNIECTMQISYCGHKKNEITVKNAIQPETAWPLCEKVNEKNDCKYYEPWTFKKWLKGFFV